MPNGFHGSREEWEQLEAPLLELDDRIWAFAEPRGLHCVRNYHNWPNRSVSWKRGDMERKVEISLVQGAPKTYDICVLAWRDVQRTRYAKKADVKRRVSFAELSARLERFLDEGIALANSWPEGNLERT